MFYKREKKKGRKKCTYNSTTTYTEKKGKKCKVTTLYYPLKLSNKIFFLFFQLNFKTNNSYHTKASYYEKKKIEAGSIRVFINPFEKNPTKKKKRKIKITENKKT